MSDLSASVFPVPDPTVLTTRQLLREIEILRGSIDDKVEARHREAAALKELLFVRIDAIERATALRARVIDDLPADNARQIGHLRELMDERFVSIGVQFEERDTRSEREARDNKLAVAAAFAAQEKQAVAQNESNALAISKSESATAETIKTNQELGKSTTDAQGKTLDEIKGQVTTILASGVGAHEVLTDRRAGTSQILAMVAVVATLFGGALTAILVQAFG